MEERDWIYREPDPNDGRSVRIFLTDKGKEKREISRLSVRRFNKEVHENLDKDKLKIFFEVINGIRGIAEDKNLINEFLVDLKLDLKS